MIENDLDLGRIYENSFIYYEYKFKGLYSNFVDGAENLEKELFLIYKYLTKNFPISQNILLCTKDTSNEELTAFLYRAILCPYNACFIVGGIESLEQDRKVKMLKLFDKLIDKMMKSCLIILYINKNSDIYKNINLLKLREDLDIPRNNYAQKKIEKNESKVEIITSKESGTGKSTKIKYDIKKSKKEYKYFPLGGVLNRVDIFKRLNNLKSINPKNCALHLDLYDTEQTDLMTEFLFSILITKIYGHDEDIFYFPKEIEIKIEIPNGFVDLIQKFPILSLFEKTIIMELPPLIVTDNNSDINDANEGSSNVQIVANYLKLLNENKLDNVDLFFKDITPKIFKSYKTLKYAEKISQEECEKLIFHEIKKNGIDSPNYYQIKSFIDVLASQLKILNRNYYINANLFNEYKLDKSIRTDIIESYIKLTKHFTKGAFSELTQIQKKTSQIISLEKYNAEQDVSLAIKELSGIKPNLISFNEFNYSLIFFHEGKGQGFSIISNLPSIIKKHDNNYRKREYEKLKKLCNFQRNKVNEEEKKIPDYTEYNQEDFYEELKTILDLKNPTTIRKKEEINEKRRKNNEVLETKKTIEEIVGKYVFTADNFIKMVLILLRIRANIPVIMMGETGCGKTSLIKMLSILLNDGSDKALKIMNIHAGTSDNDIIKFINTDVLPEAKILEREDKKIEEEERDMDQIFIARKIWVFLDEINTCKSMGLISELMCKHSYQGNKLPDNIVFIAACNPYRCYENGKKTVIGLDINKAHRQKKFLDEKYLEKLKRNSNINLVYTVNPLPHSLLNYVFDFGNLEQKDEEKYIKSMIEEPIKKFNNNKLEPNIHKFAATLIIKAQNFTREKNEISSVSLREIRRFNIVYEFFYKLFLQKKQDNNKSEGDSINIENCDNLTLNKYAIIMGVFVCYYLRIIDNKTRKEFQTIMNDELKKIDSFFLGKDFLDIPKMEENYVLDNIELEKGIAKNRALKDNIFSLFVAINNKIPIFIVGKPGCSKSLSVQLINKSMEGETSKKQLFKKLPKIIMNSYQGSMTSTSKGVERVFTRAKDKYKRLSKENKEKNISMIFFDEMGLAEHSPNNPLKVIHAKLDEALDERDDKLAFVGISNYILDASKMNRGMHLSIPDPSKEDIKETAFIIGKSYDEKMANRFKLFYENLGISYYKYKNYLSIVLKKYGKEDFHGNRDFYHLIKYSAREIVKRFKKNELNKVNIEKEIAFLGFERNFGGLKFISQNSNLLEITSIKLIKQLYSQNQESDNYEILKRVKENLLDNESRYLLIISKSSTSIFLLSSVLPEAKKDYNLFVGSQFYRDHHSEEYSLKILNKIQLLMEQGKVLILKNLEFIYPALYDLFNQNFTKMSKKNYARIAIGSSINNFSQVNDDFRCIVSVNDKQIDEEEAPFLNRFEKHILSLEFLLENDLIEESKSIFNILNEMISLNKNIFKGINFDLQKLFINFDLEEIQGIIYQAYKNGIEKKYMIDEVISKLSLTLPQDIILCLKLNGYQSKYKKIFSKIIEGYKKGIHNNLRSFLESLTKIKNIVYTYTNNLEDIKNLDNINTKIVGNISKNNIKEIKISIYKTEYDLEKEIDDFFEKEKYKACFIKFNSNEGQFINYVKFLIENKQKDYYGEKLENKNGKNNEKLIIFIVYIMRVYDSEIKDFGRKSKKEQRIINKKILKETISNLSEFYQIFIDDLNGEEKIKFDIIFNVDIIKIFESFLDFNKEFKKYIYLILSYFKFNISFSYRELNEKNYADKLIKYVEKEEGVKSSINECIKKIIKQNNKKDIIKEIFKQKNKVLPHHKDLISVIKEHLSNEYKDILAKFFFQSGKDNFFANLLSLEEDKKFNATESQNISNYQKRINKEYFKEFIVASNIKVSKNQGQNLINLYLGMKIPKVIPKIKTIINFIKDEIEKKYVLNENNLKTREDYDKNKYNKKLKEFNDSLKIELSKISLLKDKIIENDKIKNIEFFFLEDYYIFFIIENMKNLMEKNENKKIHENTLVNDIKKFLEFLVELKEKQNEKNDEKSIEKIASIINWIHCYKDEIITILQMFVILNPIVNNLNEEIKKGKYVLLDKQYNNFQLNNHYVNNSLLLGMESLLSILTSNEEIYLSAKEDDEKFYNLMNINKEILQNAFKFEANLFLTLKEAYSLQEIVEINEVLIKAKVDTKDNIKKIIQFFYKETLLIFDVELNDFNETALFEHFQNFYKYLKGIIGKSNLFPKLISTIFHNEYMKISNDYFRQKLLDIIILENDYIYNCYPLLKQIIKGMKISIDPQVIEKNFEMIKNKTDRLIGILNSRKSDILDQSILQILEHMFLEYFKKVEKLDKNSDKKYKNIFPNYIKQKGEKSEDYEKNIIFELSKDIFMKCIEELNSSKIEENNLYKLYCIAFIKIYLSKFVEFFDKYEDNEVNLILNLINDDKNLMKVIKIYVLKLIYNFNNRNWEKSFDGHFRVFKQLDTMLDQYDNDSTIQKNPLFLTNYFIPSYEKTETKFKEQISDFIVKIRNFGSSTSSDFSEDEGIQDIDEFLSISINKIISNLLTKNYLDSQEGHEIYTNLCGYCEKLFLHLNDDLKKLLNLFYNRDIFLAIFMPKFKAQKDEKIKGEPYESLLYGLRFCAQSLFKHENNKKFIYSSILCENGFNIIKNSYIPGNNVEKDRKLETYKLLEIILQDSPGNVGNYVCSCGYYYSIGPCGFPTENHSSKCPICNLPIGYGPKVLKNRGAGNHGMVIRPGHFRIFRDQQQKEEQMSIWDDPDENIPNRTLAQYKMEIIDPLLNSCQKGISRITKDEFLDKNKTIRKLSKISYRLLNFILFNHLFFANCLEYIDDKKLKDNFLIQNMNCLEIIQTNWNLLDEALKEKNISSIQSFINLIFKDLSKLISSLKIIDNAEKLIEFEEKIENIIQLNMNKYPQYYIEYSRINKELTLVNEKDIKIIIKESIPPSEKIYPEKEFPLLQYFMFTEYKSNFIDNLKQEADYKVRYPLLNRYLNISEEQKNIKYLPAFNEFTNLMVDTYSYKISREEAKKKKLKDMEDYNQDKYKSFHNSWAKIYKKAIKYKCRDEMNPKDLKPEDELIYFLNDANELGYGMYLSAACQNFILWQNEFLKPIIESAVLGGNLHYYIENMKKKIPVQEATSNQILSFDDCFKNSNYKDFNDLVYTFSKRDFYNNDKINYQKYNIIKYDFAKIEEELAKLILPEKCLFENEDKLNFMIFWGEGFRGGQSEIIQKFYLKYPQVDLNEKEKQKITSEIEKLYKEKNINFNAFFGSMQLLIFFLGNNNFAPDKKLKAIIDEKPEYLNLDSKCYSFFQDNNFKINQIMNIYFYAEHLSFKELIKTLNQEYKQGIDEKVILAIKKKLEIKIEGDRLPWNKLASATRRFISRYLVGDRQTTDIDEKTQLVFHLGRIDLWEEKFGKFDDLDDLISIKINEFQLKVGQAYYFYELIGEEDKKYIDMIEKSSKERDKEDGRINRLNSNKNEEENIKDYDDFQHEDLFKEDRIINKFVEIEEEESESEGEDSLND